MLDLLPLLSNPQTYISLLTLTLLEIVLGIDNVIFISILAGKLPVSERRRARVYGLLLAVFGRLSLLSGIAWLSKLTEPFLTVLEFELSGKDLVLLGGGLFLIFKSAQEIYEKVEGNPHGVVDDVALKKITFTSIVWQIVMIDIVFSLDSIITAVGLVSELPIMITAVLISLLIMIWASHLIGEFIDRHPSVKILALAFLLMIGTLLTAEAFGYSVPKGYVYFSLAFSLGVEALNIRHRNQLKKTPLA